MLRKLRQKLKRPVALRRGRIIVVRTRGLLERLEERAMLSVSYGSMSRGHGGNNFGSPVGGGSHFGDSAAIAPQQQRSVSYDTQTISGSRESGGSYRDLQSPPRMQSFDQHLSQSPTWNQSFASPPSPPPHSNSVPGYSYVPSGPTYIVWEYVVIMSPKDAVPQRFEPTIADGFVPPARLLARSPDSTDKPTDIVDSIEASVRPTGHNPFQPSAPLDQVRNTIPSGIGVIEMASRLTDSPTTSQIVSRETNTVAALTAVARDLAFQEFSSKLFQPNATNAYDYATLNLAGADTAESVLVDGLIRPTDESIVNESVKSSDVVDREREAVDAVLHELHDIDSLLPATTANDENSQFELQADAALDEMPAGEVDGGMVLLQSTGNANESGFDLTPVYANHLEQFVAPRKMESSVGMFQAVDVGTDDGPVVEAVPQTDSTSDLKPEVKLDENLPAQREPSSPSNKAAAVVGAATLTGALVWINRSRTKPTAQKRRHSRG